MYEPSKQVSRFVNPYILTTTEIFKILHRAGVYSMFDFGYQMSTLSDRGEITSHQVNDHVNFCPGSKSFQNILKYHGIFNLVSCQLQSHLGDRFDVKKSCFKCPCKTFRNVEFYQHLQDKGKYCAIHYIFQIYMEYMYVEILNDQKSKMTTFKNIEKRNGGKSKHHLLNWTF